MICISLHLLDLLSLGQQTGYEVLNLFMPCNKYIQTFWLRILFFLQLDGYVARKMGINSVVGSYLDPLADKVSV